MKKIFLFIFFISIGASGQDRITPGIMYHSGHKLTAPRYGVITQIPDKWVGILPQDMELFLLMSTQNQDGQIFVMGTSEQYKDTDNIDLEDGRFYITPITSACQPCQVDGINQIGPLFSR